MGWTKQIAMWYSQHIIYIKFLNRWNKSIYYLWLYTYNYGLETSIKSINTTVKIAATTNEKEGLGRVIYTISDVSIFYLLKIISYLSKITYIFIYLCIKRYWKGSWPKWIVDLGWVLTLLYSCLFSLKLLQE